MSNTMRHLTSIAGGRGKSFATAAAVGRRSSCEPDPTTSTTGARIGKRRPVRGRSPCSWRTSMP